MSWLALYKKELSLTKTKFLLNIAFLFLISLLLLLLMDKYNPYFMMIMLPVIALHLFYLFFAMLDSLRQEWKQRTSVFWLNIPSNGWSLLTAKYVAASTQLFFSLALAFVIVYMLMNRSLFHLSDPAIIHFLIEQLQSYWWILFLGIFIASLQAGAVATFIYMVSKSVRKLGWLLGIAISVAGGWAWVKFTDTAIYRGLTEWGVILREDEIANSLMFHFDSLTEDPTLHTETINNVVLYIGTSVIDLLVVLFILYVSAWLLDNKVEA